ncbi:MAG: hypothetical protein P1V19_11145 [Gimesia sp.]|nr:hypothetical protein [Gimesia sp.]
MNETEILELESAAGCQLPSSYRELLLHYPEQLTALAALDAEEAPVKEDTHWSV